MPTISYLISLFSDRTKHLDLSLRSLTSYPYDPHAVELLVFIDYTDHAPVVSVIRKYRQFFDSITVYRVTKKRSPINHSVTRRNFLAMKARGAYIIFSEPEMFHIDNTLQGFLSHTKKKRADTQWICGPVYAAHDVADDSGKLIVDESKPLRHIDSLLKLPTLKNFLSNKMFKKNYHVIDYTYYLTPFFCTMFNRNLFLKLNGLNQHLKVRGFEETEFFDRFASAGGHILVDKHIRSIHLPHLRRLDKETQISWNLYNSTVPFDPLQRMGEIPDATFTTMHIV